MAYINVDYSKLNTVADRIEEYILEINSGMVKMNGEMSGLSERWKGDDATVTLNKWNDIDSSDSTTGKLLKMMENYEANMREAAKRYKAVHERAMARARGYCF